MHIIWELLLGREPKEAEGSLFVCTCYPFNLISEYGGMRQESEGPQAVMLCPFHWLA